MMNQVDIVKVVASTHFILLHRELELLLNLL